MPLRWLPPEAVRDSEYNFHTDIWSYGVFMWEVFHLCDLPYRLLSDDDVFKAICGGVVSGANSPGMSMPSPGGLNISPSCSASAASLPRLDFAEQCPTYMVDIVRQCCAVLPSSRPTFSDLVVTVGHLLSNGADCV